MLVKDLVVISSKDVNYLEDSGSVHCTCRYFYPYHAYEIQTYFINPHVFAIPFLWKKSPLPNFHKVVINTIFSMRISAYPNHDRAVR